MRSGNLAGGTLTKPTEECIEARKIAGEICGERDTIKKSFRGKFNDWCVRNRLIRDRQRHVEP